MSCIKTYTGIMFDPLEPQADRIEIVDIAHALSMLCRANGHFKHFYSVGQHCVSCALEAEARGYSRRVQLACLLHDASEAYLSDITRPVKRALPAYLQIEGPLQDAIWNKYLDKALTEQEREQVFAVDDAVLYHEFIALMDTRLEDLAAELQTKPVFDFIGFDECERRYLELFTRLTASRQNQNKERKIWN